MSKSIISKIFHGASFWIVISIRLTIILIDRFILVFMPWRPIGKSMDVLTHYKQRKESYIRMGVAALGCVIIYLCVLFLWARISFIGIVLLVLFMYLLNQYRNGRR